ncbi:hypothetical protein [Streptoalloteichus hindustanus]|nr:hypothetical protein [Streptoalloteichus hindustanus]
MDAPDLTRHLGHLGLGAWAVSAYQALLSTGPMTADQLAAAVPGPASELTDLLETGLVALTGDAEPRYVPVPPATGLDVLSLRRRAELEQARVATQRAYDAFRRHLCGQPTEDLVEVVTGAAIPERIKQLTHSIPRQEVRRLDSPPHFYSRVRNESEERQLREGISYRVVYSRSSLRRPHYLKENIVPCMKAGEQARTLPRVPVKLSVLDRSIAFVSFTIDDTERNDSLLIVRPSSLFRALEGLFELCWRSASPLDINGGTHAHRLRAHDRMLLALLAAGADDDSIARELGISKRTFFRRLSLLMEQAGATSRFQLALHASRNDWL